MILSFSGMDGTGKTSHAKATAKYLESLGIKIKCLHAIQFSISGKIGGLLKRASKKTHKKIVDKEFERNKKTKLRSIIGIGKRLTYLLDIFRFYLAYFFYFLSGKSIICDRYFYDMQIQLSYLGMAGKNYLRLYNLLTPKPKIAFFLSVSPEKAFNRVKEYDKTYFNVKNRLYKKIKSKLIVINTNKPFNDVQNEIESKIKSAL